MKRSGFKAPRKPMRKVSKKRAAYRASDEGQAELEHMALVKQCYCVGCGAPPPNDAHHCRDKPPHDWNEGQGPYMRLPSAGAKSSGFDTIPLCHDGCHMFGPNSYHHGRANFHLFYGPDYGYIEQTRRMVAGGRNDG